MRQSLELLLLLLLLLLLPADDWYSDCGTVLLAGAG